MNYDVLLARIMDSDPNIRHAIVADAEGNIMTVKHRSGVTNLLTPQETSDSLKRAANAWKARKSLQSKVGKGLYAIAAFENLTRMTFPLGEQHLLFVSMGSEHTRMDLNQGGGRNQIIEHVLNVLSWDPTLQ
jgi:hypothetical protein